MSVLFSWKPRLSPLAALCIFLVCERHRGEASDWFPYIDVLPSTYTCPAYFSDEAMAVLPTSVQIRALKQREAVREIHSANQDFIRWECATPGLSENIAALCAKVRSTQCGRLHFGFIHCCYGEAIMGRFFPLPRYVSQKCSSWNWSSTFYWINDLIKDFWLAFRTLQPIMSEPVEKVLTYEALRSASADIQTQAHHTPQLKWNHSFIKMCRTCGSWNNWRCVSSRWAWCSVNTRSVFMSQPANSFLCGQDVYALAPFLDLLNHRPDVQVNCGNTNSERNVNDSLLPEGFFFFIFSG